MTDESHRLRSIPGQQQSYPGQTHAMDPHPHDEMRDRHGRGLLEGKRALITGGDSVDELGGLDILVNHAGTQREVERPEDLDTDQLRRTFEVNVYATTWVTRQALPHLPDGAAIINTGSINGLRGNKTLIDYAASKVAVSTLGADSMEKREDDDSRVPEDDERQPERTVHLFGRGVRTALRNNATAYGFSISITAAYGLVNAVKGPATALETVCFALGAAAAFVLVGVVFISRFPVGRLPEGGQVATISGGMDVVSVGVSVAVALGVAHTPGFTAWPLTALATVVVYLLVGGLDVVIARSTGKRTSFARRQ